MKTAWRGYQAEIANIMSRHGLNGVADPRHVEAYMRLEHPTLDAMSKAAFAKEVRICAGVAQMAGVECAEQLAQSMGILA